MKQEVDVHRDIWGPYMTGILHLWAGTVFKGVRYLEEIDIHINNTIGILPAIFPHTGTQKKLTTKGIFLKLLPVLPLDYSKVKYFDIAADEYALATEHFKSYFMERAYEIVASQVDDSFYMLDASCGPGTEAKRLSTLVPKGEVIAVDLSTEMMKGAYRNMKLEYIPNIGCMQLDIQELPSTFKNHFDLIFCSLSISYLEDVEQVFKQFYKALRKNGKLILIEPVGSASQSLTSGTMKKAIPHFKKFYTLEELNNILENTHFQPMYWEEIQQDIGLSIAMK